MKICPRCNQNKSRKEFWKDSKRKDGLQYFCSKCQGAYGKRPLARKRNQELKRKRYAVNPERYRKLDRERSEKRRGFIRTFKDVPCTDCGNRYHYSAMQFDHLKDKEFVIATGKDHRAINKLLKEIAKCEIVCANCHAIRSFKRKFNIPFNTII